MSLGRNLNLELWLLVMLTNMQIKSHSSIENTAMQTKCLLSKIPSLSLKGILKQPKRKICLFKIKKLKVYITNRYNHENQSIYFINLKKP